MAAPKHTLDHLSTLQPPAPTRAWQTTPHPYHPLLATASSDKAVRIYSLTTFTLQSHITGGHTRSVRTVGWKPGLRSDAASVLATGSFDATAGIWRGDNANPRVGGGSSSSVTTTTASDSMPDGDDEDYSWAVQLTGHDSEIKSLCWSPHGTFLATSSRDKSVWLWECLPDEDENLETVAVLQEHDGDVKSVAWRPDEEGCIASGSYDESVRIWREDVEGEWSCVGLCLGHEGTVWGVCWEPVSHMERLRGGTEGVKNEEKEEEGEAVSGPRIMSCSDDLTIRLWRRRPKKKREVKEGPRIPSIIRSTSDEETWYQAQILPREHDRAIYAIDWSNITGRVVSCGSDGRIVVYEESRAANAEDSGRDGMDETEEGMPRTKWDVIAEIEAAHGVFEINHVCWARRYDKGKRYTDEEVVVSTGDDGEVRVWTLD